MRSLVLALLLAALTLPPGLRAQDQAQPSVLVTTQPVHQGKLDQTLTAYGLVQAAPGAALNLSLPRAGEVQHLRVAAGATVDQGDALFDYGTDPAVMLAYEQAQSALTLAQQERAHTAKLVAQKLATQSQLDQADRAVRDGEAKLDEQRRLGGGRSSQTVTAPFAGVVTSLAVANGDHVQANATILQLAQSDRLTAVLGIEPEDAARVAPGLKVRVAALAHPDQAITTAIQSIGGVLDPHTQLIDVMAPVPPGPPRLLAGEHVAGEIALGEIAGWIVPRQAVLGDKDGNYVFQVADGKVARVGVAILGQEGEQTVIKGPLDPNRQLVVSGNYQLADGMAVREAMQPTAPEQASARRGE